MIDTDKDLLDKVEEQLKAPKDIDQLIVSLEVVYGIRVGYMDLVSRMLEDDRFERSSYGLTDIWQLKGK